MGFKHVSGKGNGASSCPEMTREPDILTIILIFLIHGAAIVVDYITLFFPFLFILSVLVLFGRWIGGGGCTGYSSW